MKKRWKFVIFVWREVGEETVTSEFLVISYNDKVATRKLKTPEFYKLAY